MTGALPLVRLPRRVVRSIRNGFLVLLDAADRLAGRGDGLTPPRALHFVGGGDFRAVGRAFLGHFRNIGGLGPEDRILDVGCGTGRMAIPLLGYAGGRGEYTGFDICRPAIDWCARNISSRNPRFRFFHADIYNLEYNPHGTVSADAFRFPCEDGGVDFAFATSVFTHMHAGEVRRYLDELRRVLRPGGRALVTFFIFEDSPSLPAGQRRPAMNFRYPVSEGYTIDPDTPERAIGYSESWIRAAVRAAGLAVEDPIRYGSWSGRADGVDFQDMVLLRKGAGPAERP
jgi:SAM-dependent methyltransferase